METFTLYQEKDEAKKDEEQGAEVDENPSDFVKVSNGFEEAKKMRIKVVLTKEELEWLVFQLENYKNEKSLEDILEEIESSRESYRGKIVSWKPSLESIKESPEVLEMER